MLQYDSLPCEKAEAFGVGGRPVTIKSQFGGLQYDHCEVTFGSFYSQVVGESCGCNTIPTQGGVEGVDPGTRTNTPQVVVRRALD